MARGRSGRKTDFTWLVGTASGASIGSAGAALQLIVFNTASTITRSRGNILTMMDVGAANDGAIVGYGLIVGTDAQVAVGVTAFPSPLTVGEGDFLWHQIVPLRSETGTQSDDLSSHVARSEIDSKAMRRVRQNDQLVLVMDVVLTAGSPTVDFVMGARVLVGI